MASEISLLRTTLEQTPQTTYLDQILELIPTLCSLWFRGSCYVLGAGVVNMTTARDRCSAMGAYLVEIDDAEEQAKLDELLRGADYWIGATDSEQEGAWKWAGTGRGLELGFQNWQPGEPNNYGDSEHCAEAENAVGRLWNDLPCNLERHYVCETRTRLGEMSVSEISLLKTNLELSPLVACKDQIRELVPLSCSLSFRGHCYEVFQQAIYMTIARERCSCMGAYLVEIDDAEEQAKVDQLAGGRNVSEYWLGATDLEQEGVWKWDRSGGPLGFQKWQSDEEDDNDGIEDCAVSVVGRHWDDRQCSDRKYYVCEKLTCSLLFRGHCYVVGDDVVNKTTARESCSAIGAYLVEIDDAEEQAKVDELAEGKDVSRHWIGANDLEEEGVWKWDGSGGSLEFLNWESHEPDNYGGNEHCAISVVGRHWNDRPCSDKIQYVCEKRADM